MADNFQTFAGLVNKSLQRLLANNPFVVTVESESAPATLFERYLSAFPEGSDPIFKKRSEHDCSCCRHFIKNVGDAVNIDENGNVVTVWDDAAESAPYPYNIVAAKLRDEVRAAPITDVFRTNMKEYTFGNEVTRSNDENMKVLTWRHFYSGPVPMTLRSATPDAVRGQLRTDRQVFERGLKEVSSEAVSTILSIIDSGESALYKGREFRPVLNYFQNYQSTYNAKEGKAREAFLWLKASPQSASFRGSAIGKLAVALSEPGADLVQEVAAYERMVAPENYKRTSALVTPGMVKKAMETITELNLEPALERRLAKIRDIDVNDVLWVNRKAKSFMKGGGGLGDMLREAVAGQEKVDEEKATPISIDTFVSDILPTASEIELFFKNDLASNLVALTAPVNEAPAKLFKWEGDFAWCYTGNVTDSMIKERVKKAGGKVTDNELRVSLSWSNYDDLDVHVVEPSGERIYFAHRRSQRTGGTLDVDMNAGGGTSRTPVENIAWPNKVPDGKYEVIVNNYTRRERTNEGFTIEVESGGKLVHFTAHKNPDTRQNVAVVTLVIKDGRLADMVNVADTVTASASTISMDKWGVKTETFLKVNAVTLSPNFWHGQSVGNKHTFFFCDGVVADEPLRGIYNEFLDGRLEPHRKVFDLVGEKTKCAPTPDGLAGVGFSVSKKANVILKVTTDGKRRLYNVQVG